MKKNLSILICYLFLSLPAFAVTNLADNSPVTFDDYIGKGKWTVMEIWSYSCPACKTTMHHLSDFDAVSQNYNAQVIGVSLDGPDFRQQALNFVENQSLEFPNLLANVVEVQQLIHSNAPRSPLGTPTVMLFSPEGAFAGIVVGAVTNNELIQYFEEQKSAEAKADSTEETKEM